jgi:hypothetical protein
MGDVMIFTHVRDVTVGCWIHKFENAPAAAHLFKYLKRLEDMRKRLFYVNICLVFSECLFDARSTYV